MNIDKQALREEFRLMQAHYSDPADRARQVIYIAAEALLDELETKEEQRANWFQMAQKLGEDLDAAEKRNAEQREYYEGVIADGSKRIAELETREVTLPAQRFCPGEYVGSVLWAETEIWNKAISACAVAVRAAGIKVKGE
ncbi:ead/Ea22-like family protein [Salmonella enterica]|uniref:ead/Ea22-like family protein n=1 Tax=Salmonella enterica TaxID=28901 RepID=UPI000D571294|nr:ead/Ea22-like family protein [Salmonella enterica]EAA3728139.1 ead/Ea22-like family protein [Salmonella enterica subsp. enterica serovar Newport]ECS6832350.1 ead/Ea22-like family protein [Salmonella enterica subsp. enterica serovar Javiana]EDS7122226.1 ead/Ea22-like family protein [Salmonella enterica subsp. enterica]EDZ0837811.1 ead/Ea22-like family protein [Salmonella enterica subsp. enterica serovar Saintpaul]EEN4012582.1 ead/Ea22-like family protein [Salmonella enterica subsp. enterica 